MFPAQNTNFQLGYFVESRRNKKFRIVDRCTLQSLYDTQVVGSHHSEDTPPNVPYLRERESLQPKEKAGASIAESVAAADTATRYGFAMIILHFHLQPQLRKRSQLIKHLKDLKMLLDDNVLTEEEYKAQKVQILNEMQN
ncbi:unnamed protein product [Porites evermanni]|uniref:SHOCT domain-containing protein n=1 Tax=Porites evermanni TaxID=104178 RepID=A0ABN8PGG4_9CNID|nr:unnamed protein product [Porites evermanni]